MRFSQLTLLFCLLLVTTYSFAQTKAIPDVTVKSLTGESVDLKSFAENGKITVISFWATWCAPCKKELDAIAEVYTDWQKDYNMELVAVSIDTRRALATVPGLVSSKGWEYTVLTGKATELQNAFNFQTIPQTFVIDQKGAIVYHHNGYVPGDEYELEDKLKELGMRK